MNKKARVIGDISTSALINFPLYAVNAIEKIKLMMKKLPSYVCLNIIKYQNIFNFVLILHVHY